jgi:hypothetical protein
MFSDLNSALDDMISCLLWSNVFCALMSIEHKILLISSTTILLYHSWN